MANKVYKGRQKLNLEQASNYYKHAYKIGVDHGRFEERDRIIKLIEEAFYYVDYEGLFSKSTHVQVGEKDVIAVIKGDK